MIPAKKTTALITSGLALIFSATAMTLGAPAASAATTVSATPANSPQAQADNVYTGTFQHADGCKILRSPRGYYYIIHNDNYKIGNNGGLYGPKGFIAYPNWRINVSGTFHKNVGATFCTTYPLSGWIDASSVTTS